MFSLFLRERSKLLVKNYRRISLTNVFSELMESLVRKQVVDFVEVNNLFAQSQSGVLDLAVLLCLS